ncbi:hypothetical protein GE09DRAFT_1044529 [Coniochaeta sp. 2T2.1]|nr:hypothetical protein GE09DRAFT_1044529 [Coniochaeta sp. 2T2.1]
MDPSSSPAAIKSQVLQTTLAEISSSARAATSTSSGCSASPTAAPAPDCCVICLEEVSEPGTALPCRHSNFDFLCLANWLAVGDAKCPLCKAAVLEVRYADSTGVLRTYIVPPVASTSTSSTDTSTSSSSASPSPGIRSAQTTFQLYFLNRSSTNPRRNNRPRYATTSSRTIQTTSSTPSSALLKRKYIYTHNLYSLHIGANPLSRYRSGPTPADFASDPNLVSRARTFIRRELQVFSFLSSTSSSSTTSSAPPSSSSSSSRPSSSASPSRSSTTGGDSTRRANNAEFLLEYTIAILKTVDTQGAAGQAEDMLSDFLGRDSARLFLHELRGWLRSPCLTLEAWDRGVQYPDPDHDRDTRVGGKREARGWHDGDGGEEEVDGAREGEFEEGGRRRGRGSGTWGGRGDGDGEERKRKGDYWRPGYGRYEGRKRRRTTGGS